jgi:phospholipid N-methyltransferase
MNSKLKFISNFIKNPKEVAAISTSSRYIINKIIENIDFENAACIVEYGPGVGTITKEILENLNSDAKLICFELNQEFCKHLSDSLKDPRLVVINDTVENLDFHLKKLKIKNIDYAFSGIPFSLIKEKNKKIIVRKTRDYLRDGGKFIVYQYSTHMKKYLRIYFNKVSINFEPRNLPPNFIMICEKT